MSECKDSDDGRQAFCSVGLAAALMRSSARTVMAVNPDKYLKEDPDPVAAEEEEEKEEVEEEEDGEEEEEEESVGSKRRMAPNEKESESERMIREKKAIAKRTCKHWVKWAGTTSFATIQKKLQEEEFEVRVRVC